MFGVGAPAESDAPADGDTPSNCWNKDLVGDEDRDMRADGCDPCPADADTTNGALDDDGDGVGDVCDVDSSLLHQWSMFSGFHDPAHGWNIKSGLWAVRDDAFEQADATGGVATRELVAIGNPVVEVAITSTSSINLAASATVELYFGLATARCGYRYDSGSDNLVLEVTGQPPTAVGFDAPAGLRIRMYQDTNGRIHCSATSASGTSDELRSQEITSQVTTMVSLATELTPAAFQWVSIYGRTEP